MKLNPDSFDKIKNGSKIIEVRLNDRKRREINVGDTIIFLREPEKVETLETFVIGLLKFNNFEDLVNDYSPVCFGSDSKGELLSEIRKYYSKEQEKQYGVLGIRVSVK
jgi:ASC-1-like (ASCH) protein